ncbi:MAG: TrkA C-terminal domain-containing protein [Nitrospirota bacterium]|nr:TrkA C-terminal domain-containing protein [Nitrospirota bacterium]MDE3241263.1 TrkA C-terminal domain-containing protein [Nitrospirota bacterium]
MTTEFLHRIRKELTVTFTGLHEAIIAVSERVNRKVQILKLHWQASAVDQQVEAIHQMVGEHLVARLTQDGTSPNLDLHLQETGHLLAEATSRIRVLKGDLMKVEALMRELESETLRETLLKVQHDLFTRAATLERVVVSHGAGAAGRSAAQVGLAASTHVIAILRGSAILAQPETITFRPGDIVILIGRREDLQTDAALFTQPQRQRALA